jgi:hypothetical protein
MTLYLLWSFTAGVCLGAALAPAERLLTGTLFALALISYFAWRLAP